jgi:hypothetical protein
MNGNANFWPKQCVLLPEIGKVFSETAFRGTEVLFQESEKRRRKLVNLRIWH